MLNEEMPIQADGEDDSEDDELIEMGVTVRHSLSLRFRGPSAN